MSKRANGEGSIYQRADGVWRGQYTAADGKRRNVYAKTQKELTKKLRAVMNTMDRGEWVEPSQMTVGEWLNIWLRDWAPLAVRASTLATYADTVRLHLLPGLGAYRLQDPRLADRLQTFVNKQAQAGFAPATVKRQIAVFQAAMKKAVERRLCFHNPAATVVRPKQEQKEIEFLTREEIARVLPCLPGSTQGRALRFILGTGLRVGELCGLRWCDIDGEGVHVNQTAYTLQQNGKQTVLFNPPKTRNGKRVIPMNAKLEEILTQQRQTQRAERLRAGSAWQGPEAGGGRQFIFATMTGGPADRANLARCLRESLKAAGLKSRGVHALRHTFATQWVQSGADLKTLSEILGHANVAFTMQKYVHSDTNIKRQGMTTMAEII